MKNQKETYVLVHSAWLGAWQWGNISKLLTEEGHRVITPDLPGHGTDKTSPANITMEMYVETILEILNCQEQPVVLVGHSFNGITISRVAELRPDKVKGLVYLTAFLLPNGGSFFDAVQGVQGSKAVDNFYLSDDETYALVKEDEIQNAFAHDVSKEVFDSVKSYIVPEPTAPLLYELEVSEANYGSIPKYYIECTEDRAIPIEVQRAMYTGNVLKVYTINSSHTPNFSQPEKVAAVLNNISGELQKVAYAKQFLQEKEWVKVHRLFSNPNQVLVHAETKNGDKTFAEIVLIELSEIENPNRYYHVKQEVPIQQVGGITMFDGAKIAANDTNAIQNEVFISRFLNDVWIGGNVSILQDFFHDGKVIQHNPMVKNDVEGLFDFMKHIEEQGIALQYKEVLATFAEGDMVMTCSKGMLSSDPHIFADLFRLENGRIVEHWDVIEKQ